MKTDLLLRAKAIIIGVGRNRENGFSPMRMRDFPSENASHAHEQQAISPLNDAFIATKFNHASTVFPLRFARNIHRRHRESLTATAHSASRRSHRAPRVARATTATTRTPSSPPHR